MNVGICILLCVLLIAALIGPTPYRDGDRRRVTYEKVLSLRDVWPDRQTSLLGLLSSFYANYIGHDRCIPIEPLVTVIGGDVKSGGVRLDDVLAIYDPDAVLIGHRLLGSRNFDRSSLEVLDTERWAVHEIGDDKVYFLKRN